MTCLNIPTNDQKSNATIDATFDISLCSIRSFTLDVVQFNISSHQWTSLHLLAIASSSENGFLS